MNVDTSSRAEKEIVQPRAHQTDKWEKFCIFFASGVQYDEILDRWVLTTRYDEDYDKKFYFVA